MVVMMRGRFLFVVLLTVCLSFLASCTKTQMSHSGKYGHIHKVRTGDTLYSIGKRFSIDYQILATRNRIKWPYRIFVGQHIYLDRKSPKSAYMPLPKAPKVVAKKAKKKSVASKNKKKKRQKKKYAPPVAHRNMQLRWPVQGKLSSRFGKRGSRMHDGIDIAAKKGTPIYAAAAGEVVYSDSRLSGYGKLIIIRHSRDLFTAYAHNDRNLVKKGISVKSGALIAKVGNSGRSRGSHLHFEVRRGATPVDPLSYLLKR
ncbi:MAG: M23 family metallopeptidase [Mariprofundaceae bacterium]